MTEIGEINIPEESNEQEETQVEATMEADTDVTSTEEVTLQIPNTTQTTTTTTKTTEVNGDINKNTDKYPNGATTTAVTTEGPIACTLAPAESFISTERDVPVKIRFTGEEGSATQRPPLSVMEFFKTRVEKFPNRVALKVERNDVWLQWTYKEYLEEVKTTAKAFIKLGLEPYHGVGILGFNSPEWLFSCIAAIYAGGLSSGIYTTNSPEACQYVCADAKCNIVVVENDVQLQKILLVRDKIPTLKAIVQYTGELKEKTSDVYSWNELLEIGKAEDDVSLEKRMYAQSPNKCCSLIYTSGTTGNPKGVMISHDNLMAASFGALEHIRYLCDPDGPEQEVFLSYLPLSHIAAQMQDIWLPVGCNGCVAFARPDALKGSLVNSLLQIRPTMFVGVPRVYEKIEEKLKAVGATTTGLKKKLGAWAKGKALKGNQNIEAGLPVPYGWTLATIVLKKIRVALGLDRAKFMITAAAPISKQTMEYFQSLNMPLSEVYGCSESTGAVTLNHPADSRITSIGKVLAVNDHKVANPDPDGSGELMYRGRNIFMGYLNNEEKTKESIDDEGWLHTGDVGKQDADGYFYITGRIKELLITAGGENVAPVPLEDNLKAELPFVSTAMVIGDKKKFLSCLLTVQVVIDLNSGLPTDDLLPTAKNYFATLGLDVTKASEVAPDVPEALKNAIQEGFDRANKKAASNACRVQKWHLLPHDFTTEGGELGPTQKLRRPHVMKMPQYKEIVDGFYA